MLKKIFFAFLVSFFIPIIVFAQSQALTEGAVVQPEKSQKMYLIHNGQKWRIMTAFTLRELGFTKKDLVKVGRDELEQLPNGENIRISPSKIRGIFDMHEHYRVNGNMDLFLSTAAKIGIAKTVFVPTGMGPDNAGYKDHMAALLELQKKYPDKIIAYCTVDEADPSAPEIFKKCLGEGGQGLKLMAGHPEFYDVPLDNDITKQLFTIVRDRDLPVLIHNSIITLPKAETELKNLMDQFPETRLQFAHYCSSVYDGIHLDKCSAFLDKYPNLYIDLTMGGGIERYFKYTTENIQIFKDFLLKYQDRIMVGSDLIIAPRPSPTANPTWLRNRMMCDYSLQQEKWYKCPAMNNKGKYTILPGFNLSLEVLRKFYIENPKKFLKIK